MNPRVRAANTDIEVFSVADLTRFWKFLRFLESLDMSKVRFTSVGGCASGADGTFAHCPPSLTHDGGVLNGKRDWSLLLSQPWDKAENFRLQLRALRLAVTGPIHVVLLEAVQVVVGCGCFIFLCPAVGLLGVLVSRLSIRAIIVKAAGTSGNGADSGYLIYLCLARWTPTRS